MMFMNLTPHAIVLISPSGRHTTVPPSGTVARVLERPGMCLAPGAYPDLGDDPDCSLHLPSVREGIEGLPEPAVGVILIVSAIVASVVKRIDIYRPGTGPKDGALLNERGQIVGVTRLIRSC